MPSLGLMASADDDLDDFLRQATDDLKSFRDKALSDHAAFRDSVLSELSQWLSQPWEPRPMESPIPTPLVETPIPPPVIPLDEPTPKDEPVLDNPVVMPLPEPTLPQPQPILPTIPVSPQPDYFAFTSYGTEYKVDADKAIKSIIPSYFGSVPSETAAQVLERIDGEQLNRLTSSIISESRHHNLSDWAFFKLTRHFADSFLPDNTNGSRLLQGILLLSAGYDIRFAENEAAKRLYLLIGCNEMILNQTYYILDGDKRFYPFEDMPDDGVNVASERFGDTRRLSAQPSGKEIFDMRQGVPHEVIVCTHSPHCLTWKDHCSAPEAKYSLTGNLNRMDFLSECPAFLIPGHDYTKWTTYAQSQISDEYEKQLYPSLRHLFEQKNQLEAVNFLMKFVEAFDYKLDSEMWGVVDRAFFPDETLHYPFRDCEDGAILLTRLVRDLLGLKTALIYYPGHLAAAVAFDYPVTGAHIDYNGTRYTVCDPTYYYVDAGVQMPPEYIDASKAVLIPLR